MNTKTFAALLLPFLTLSLSAQELKLETSAGDGLQARVYGAADGAMVVLAIGAREGAIKLPGGHVLGIDSPMLAGFVISEGGATKLDVPLPRQFEAFDCVAQAVALHSRLPMDAPGGIALSEVQKVRVEGRK